MPLCISPASIYVLYDIDIINFCLGTFCPGTFYPGTFCPGTFCPGTFYPGTFCPGTFCPEHFVRGHFVRVPSCTYFLHVVPNTDESWFNVAQKKFYAHTDFEELEGTVIKMRQLNNFDLTTCNMKGGSLFAKLSICTH